MRIIAVDPGTKCGIAWTDDGTIHAHLVTCADLKPRRMEGGGMRFLRLSKIIEDLAPDRVFYEEVRRHMGTDAAHVYGGLVAVLTSYCEAHETPYMGVPVGTIKKHATGKGNAGKPAMIAAAKEKYGYTGDDDNEADALHLLAYGLEVV